MKTEINLENKAKFFAQYWGQKILSLNSGETIIINGNNINKIFIIDVLSHLFLKPILSITDEEAIEVAKVGLPARSNYYLWSKITGNDIAHSISRGDQTDIYYSEFRMADAFDYLRSKGYAVSWMGLSVEEMVEVGWIKLITPKS